MPTRLLTVLWLALVVAIGVPHAGRAEEPAKAALSTDWPRWRGSNADGVGESRNLPVK